MRTYSHRTKIQVNQNQGVWHH